MEKLYRQGDGKPTVAGAARLSHDLVGLTGEPAQIAEKYIQMAIAACVQGNDQDAIIYLKQAMNFGKDKIKDATLLLEELRLKHPDNQTSGDKDRPEIVSEYNDVIRGFLRDPSLFGENTPHNKLLSVFTTTVTEQPWAGELPIDIGINTLHQDDHMIKMGYCSINVYTGKIMVEIKSPGTDEVEVISIPVWNPSIQERRAVVDEILKLVDRTPCDHLAHRLSMQRHPVKISSEMMSVLHPPKIIDWEL